MTVKLLHICDRELMLARKTKCVRDAWISLYIYPSYQTTKIAEIFWIHSSPQLQETFDFSLRDASHFP